MKLYGRVTEHRVIEIEGQNNKKIEVLVSLSFMGRSIAINSVWPGKPAGAPLKIDESSGAFNPITEDGQPEVVVGYFTFLADQASDFPIASFVDLDAQ